MPRVTISTVAESVAAELRDRLLAGEFPPGAYLSDVQLSAEYGVARPTIRAAVQQLVAEGLLRRNQGRSAHLPELGEADVRDLFFVRLPLERVAAVAVTRNGGPTERLHRVVVRLEGFGVDANWHDVADADMEFHRALIEGVGNSRLIKVYGAIQTEIRACLAQLRPAYDGPSELAAEHRRLVVAIDAGDEAAAASMVEEHLTKGLDDLVRLLRCQPQER